MWNAMLQLRRRVAAGGGSSLLVRDDDGDRSAGELLGLADRLRSHLVRICERPTIAVEAGNEWRPVVPALAVAELGGTLALLSPKMTAAEAEMAFEDVWPDAVVCSAEAATRWELDDAVPIAVDGWVIARPPRLGPPHGDARERWGAGVVIGLTSGSTGRPKAIVQSEDGMRYAIEHAAAAAGLRPGEPIATVSLLASCPTFAFGPYLSMLTGSPTTIWRRWDPARVLRRLNETGVRWLICVPTHVLQLAAAARETGVRLDHMRAIACGGGPMDAELMLAAEEALGVKVLRMFGMSECLGHTTVALDDADDFRLTTEGYPFPGTEHRLVDAGGQPVAAGEVGEIQVRGPSQLLGYAREGRLQGAGLTDDGFFSTGDLASLRPDGRLRITGRKKDVIMRGGKGIDPAEVELALARHPAVVEVCVVGISDPIMGERVAAAIVTSDDSVDSDALCGFLESAGVPRHKWPEHVVPFADELPKTGTRKIARARVKEIVEAQVAEPASAAAPQEAARG